MICKIGILTPEQSDEVKSYIDWAIENGFAVVDVNFPQQITKADESSNGSDSYSPKSAENALANQTKELLSYLWENYFELLGNVSITLVGVGDANLGIKQLLTFKGKYVSPLSILSH